MTVGSETLTFTYDANGAPLTVTYGGSTYYYATNLQGDVIAILNSTGTRVVSYTYDAWGNILNSDEVATTTLGTLNPLRYRGYVYDHETGLYYLQSRYYNPEVGRFINADMLLATGQGLLGNNMFAYCLNNPANNADDAGTVARSCLHDSGAIDDSPWRDHSIGGGGRPRRNYTSGNDYGEVADKFYTVKFMRMLGAGAMALWNAYVHSNELQVQAQYQRDMDVIGFWEETTSSVGKTVDFGLLATSGAMTYASYVAFAASPTVGAGVALGIGIITLVLSALRYYKVIPD